MLLKNQKIENGGIILYPNRLTMFEYQLELETLKFITIGQHFLRNFSIMRYFDCEIFFRVDNFDKILLINISKKCASLASKILLDKSIQYFITKMMNICCFALL